MLHARLRVRSRINRSWFSTWKWICKLRSAAKSPGVWYEFDDARPGRLWGDAHPIYLGSGLREAGDAARLDSRARVADLSFAVAGDDAVEGNHA